MQKNNLIVYIPDARGETRIPTFQGRRVVVDDGMTNNGGVYKSYIFGAQSVGLGQGAPKMPIETDRNPDAANGGGAEIMYDRWEWTIHPAGYRFTSTPPDGGPSNAPTLGNLAHADSWSRVYSERKQVPIACLITREHS